jgi:hypothetical protein
LGTFAVEEWGEAQPIHPYNNPSKIRDMKQMIFLFAVSLLTVGCDKDQTHEPIIPFYLPGAQDTGWGKAQRDGQNWEATAFARRHQDGKNYIGIDLWTFSEEGFIREKLSLNEILLLEGKYPIKGNIANTYDGLIGGFYTIAQDDGDVAGPPYDHDDSDIGTLELSKVDTANNVVAGKFDRIVFKNRNKNSVFPKKVVFENGSFEMKIIQ